jgi:hypothetical protein
MAPRRAKDAKATQDEKVQQEVEKAFDLTLKDDTDSNDDARWMIDNTKLQYHFEGRSNSQR